MVNEAERYYRRKNRQHDNSNAIVFAIVLWIVIILVIGKLVGD